MMRTRWACPDLGEPKPDGYHQPVPGSEYDFPDCPAAYLRDCETVRILRETRPTVMADHLVDGVLHPSNLVGEVVFALDNGAERIAELPPKVRALAMLHMSERASRDEYAREQRKVKK